MTFENVVYVIIKNYNNNNNNNENENENKNENVYLNMLYNEYLYNVVSHENARRQLQRRRANTG